MTSIQAFADLHVHIEYDSRLDVVAAAMATVAEDGTEDEHRALISHDIGAAIGHLMDPKALAPAGSPIRVTEWQVVDAGAEDHDDPETAHAQHPGLDSQTAEMIASQMGELFRSTGLDADDMELIQFGMDVVGVLGAPPFELPEALARTPEDAVKFVAEWALMNGYIRQACGTAIDGLFDDVQTLRERGWGTTLLANFLPARHIAQYDEYLLRRFIVTLSEVTTRLVTEWEEPSNIAQTLATRLLIGHAQDLAKMDGKQIPDEFFEVALERLVDLELLEEADTSDELALSPAA